jgi:hypothetical protein
MLVSEHMQTQSPVAVLIRSIDNVAMLGLALHMWTMGYYVDQDGNVKDI